MQSYGLWLACALAVLPASAAAAQQAPPQDSDRTTLLFDIGMAALPLAGQTGARAARRDLHDRAIDAFRRSPRLPGPSHGTQRNETPR